jgi:hypothetical protein
MKRKTNLPLFSLALAALALAACSDGFIPLPSQQEPSPYEPPSDPIVPVVGDLGSDDGKPVFVSDFSNEPSPPAPSSSGNPPPAPTTNSAPPAPPPLFGAPLGGEPPPSMELDTDPEVVPVTGDLGDLGDPPRPHSTDVPPVVGDLEPPRSSAPNSAFVPSSGLGGGKKAWDIGAGYTLPQSSTTPAAPMQPMSATSMVFDDTAPDGPVSNPNRNQLLAAQILFLSVQQIYYQAQDDGDDDDEDDWDDISLTPAELISLTRAGLIVPYRPGFPVRLDWGLRPFETLHFDNGPPPPDSSTPYHTPLNYDPDAPIPVFPLEPNPSPATGLGAGDQPSNANMRRKKLLNEATSPQSGSSFTSADHPANATMRRQELLENAETHASNGVAGEPGPHPATSLTRKQELLEESKTGMQAPHSTGMGSPASNRHELLQEEQPKFQSHAVSRPQQRQVFEPQQRQTGGGNSVLHEQTFGPSSGGHSFGAPGGFAAPRSNGFSAPRSSGFSAPRSSGSAFGRKE